MDHCVRNERISRYKFVVFSETVSNLRVDENRIGIKGLIIFSIVDICWVINPICRYCTKKFQNVFYSVSLFYVLLSVGGAWHTRSGLMNSKILGGGCRWMKPCRVPTRGREDLHKTLHSLISCMRRREMQSLKNLLTCKAVCIYAPKIRYYRNMGQEMTTNISK